MATSLISTFVSAIVSYIAPRNVMSDINDAAIESPSAQVSEHDVDEVSAAMVITHQSSAATQVSIADIGNDVGELRIPRAHRVRQAPLELHKHPCIEEIILLKDFNKLDHNNKLLYSVKSPLPLLEQFT